MTSTICFCIFKKHLTNFDWLMTVKEVYEKCQEAGQKDNYLGALWKAPN